MDSFSSIALLTDPDTIDRIDSLGLNDLSLQNRVSAKIADIQEWSPDKGSYLLAFVQGKLQLISSVKSQNPLCVDFTSGAVGFRSHQNVRNEMLVKAVLGRDKRAIPSVIDATAGLGRDSLILAVLGCNVSLCERNAVVAALLADGLYRFAEVDNDGIAERMRFHIGDFRELTHQLPVADVIYLDPMFPKREKSALVKKEMQVFKDVVGGDEDADLMLAAAKATASKKVVVKRSSKAGFLAGEKPTYSITGRSSRFDIYQC